MIYTLIQVCGSALGSVQQCGSSDAAVCCSVWQCAAVRQFAAGCGIAAICGSVRQCGGCYATYITAVYYIINSFIN
jgi:hypothetical protein